MEMEAATVPQVQKREFVNQTNGWIGVVVLDPMGQERGISVEPHGTVWLSEAEQILTARAPRLPEDNPFVEQKFIGINRENQREEFQMAPLVPADNDPRYVPSQDRYVPPPAATGAAADTEAAVAARGEGSSSPQAAARAAQIVAAPPVQGSTVPAGPVAPQGAAAPPSTGSQAHQPSAPPAPAEEAEDGRKSWTEAPPAPGQVLPGSLGGTDEPSPEATQAQAPDPTTAPQGAAPPPQPPIPPQPPTAPPMSAAELRGDSPPSVGEEHAAVDPQVGEETGAARPPSQPPVEGEFAQAEEVGSPDAPARGTDSEAG